ncbi:MAG: metallophosphoesterase [Clostridia bacterium]|nr:metallophosphoesterase [Clostridia bacterium]
MKRIVILSDTHGNCKGVDALRPIFAENDYIVHLGDGAWEARTLLQEFPEKTYACAGNCDFAPLFPYEGILEVEQVRILYCHGHRYGVKSSLTHLAFEAKKKGCDIVLYGHTHTALITELDGVTLINPGSAKYPVAEGGSYCYLVINGNKATPVIVGESFF